MLIGLLFNDSFSYELSLGSTYPSIVEKLIFFKQDKFKVFYGGPVDRIGNGVRWVMPIVFEDYENKTRAVYEVSFINCDLSNANGAEVIYVDVLDVNIKLRNVLSKDYAVFSSLLNGDYKDGKYIIIRSCDVANVYYPDVFIHTEHGKKIEKDKLKITQFLHENFDAQDSCNDCYIHNDIELIDEENEDEIVYKPIKVAIEYDEKLYDFFVMKRIIKNDAWKMYYLISRVENIEKIKCPLVRIDSGCVSGQIYDDQACDCIDQLHDALKQLAQDETNNGLIIHIPSHDGRGFGTAPKAETEIYKRGGKGRVNSTFSLDTVAAAKLLYGSGKYDLRTYDGVAEILRSFGIKKVILLTDNVEKVSVMQKHGIEVIRQKTNTNKSSCLFHLNAKKVSELYYSE